MTKMEQVAAAIATALGDNLMLAFLSKSSWTHARGIAVDGSFRDINAPLRSDYFDAARAAVEAMREPSEDMIKAAWVLSPEQARVVFTTMIDAILNEKP